MKTITFILTALLATTIALAKETPILQCHALGEGDIVTIQVIAKDNHDLILKEYYDNGKIKTRAAKRSELETSNFKLSSYYGYERTLKKSDNDLWIMEWSCGESFEIICTET